MSSGTTSILYIAVPNTELRTFNFRKVMGKFVDGWKKKREGTKERKMGIKEKRREECTL